MAAYCAPKTHGGLTSGDSWAPETHGGLTLAAYCAPKTHGGLTSGDSWAPETHGGLPGGVPWRKKTHGGLPRGGGTKVAGGGTNSPAVGAHCAHDISCAGLASLRTIYRAHNELRPGAGEGVGGCTLAAHLPRTCRTLTAQYTVRTDASVRTVYCAVSVRQVRGKCAASVQPPTPSPAPGRSSLCARYIVRRDANPAHDISCAQWAPTAGEFVPPPATFVPPPRGSPP